MASLTPCSPTRDLGMAGLLMGEGRVLGGEQGHSQDPRPLREWRALHLATHVLGGCLGAEQAR